MVVGWAGLCGLVDEASQKMYPDGTTLPANDSLPIGWRRWRLVQARCLDSVSRSASSSCFLLEDIDSSILSELRMVPRNSLHVAGPTVLPGLTGMLRDWQTSSITDLALKHSAALPKQRKSSRCLVRNSASCFLMIHSIAAPTRLNRNGAEWSPPGRALSK